MKDVVWVVQAVTKVDTDDEDEAMETVRSIFERREMPDDCGKALQTTEVVIFAKVPTEGDEITIEINRPEAQEIAREAVEVAKRAAKAQEN